MLLFAPKAIISNHMPPVKVNRDTPKWMQEPPETFLEKVALLKLRKHRINERNPEGEFLRRLRQEVRAQYKEVKQRARSKDPFQFAKPSYEQMLVLNCWLYGVMWIGIYTANRMGKTAVTIWNFLLWILPNNPKWKIFRKYRVGDLDPDPDLPLEDPNNANWGKLVHVLPRPSLHTIKRIRNAALKRPLEIPAPDPRLPHYHPQNRPFLLWMQKQVPEAFKTAWPRPPWDQDGILWYGGPDHDHFVETIMPIWRDCVPEKAMSRYVETNRSMTFEITYKIPPHHGKKEETRTNVWRFVGKSFDAKKDKWASGAVDAILVTEGMPPDKWKEIKARFKDPGIGSHDYTPYDPANVGSAVALAQRIYKGIEPVPLPAYVFSGWSVHTCPRHIMSQDKYNELVKAYKNDPEGPARLEGKFYASSALVLSNLRRDFHLLDWNIKEVFARFPNCQLFRGIDPGLDHPTAATWAALLPTNQWIVYRILCEAGLSISQRCEKIIRMSHNRTEKVFFGRGPEDYYLQEVHPFQYSEVYMASPIDYHVFKQDEVTGQAYALNYQVNGLAISESMHTGPEDRAMLLDDMLKVSDHVADLRTHKPPGCRVYFLRGGHGILDAFAKWEEMYWARKKSGDDKGQPKDAVPEHGDDELDSTCYTVCGPYKWTAYRPPARIPREIERNEALARAKRLMRRPSGLYVPVLHQMQSDGRIHLPSPSETVSIFGDVQPELEYDDERRVDRLY